MSFESPDDTGEQLYNPSIEGAYGPATDAKDGYSPPDFVPPEDTYAAVNAIEPQPLRESLSYRQVHYLDGHVVIGEHPDEHVVEYVDARIQELQTKDARELDFFTAMPHYPDAGNGHHANAVDVLRADFGQKVTNTPIAIISGEDYQQYNNLFTNGEKPAVDGFYSAGHITLVDRPKEVERFGELHSTLVLLHEGAHSSMTDEEYVVSARPLTNHDTKITKNEQTIGHCISVLRIGGFKGFNPSVHPSKLLGVLWEESFAGSYTYRRKDEVGVPTTFDAPSRRLYWGDQGPKYAIVFADSGPYYDRTNKALNIPWQYAKGFHRFDGKGIPKTVALNASTYGAFALDILDSKLPGLFDEMMQSRREPALKSHIEARIDSIAPGLYRDLSLSRWDIPNAERALIKVIKALHIADDHYEV
jgi:hypothetical protein